MAIQVVQISGDTVELVFNPAEDTLHVGENLSVVGYHEDRGLIIQVIELKIIFSAFRLSSPHQYASEGLPTVAAAVSSPLSRSPRRRKSPRPAHELEALHLAIAKIRQMTDPAWHPWDGWIPLDGVSVSRTTDREMLSQCTPEVGDPLWLGETLAGEAFHIHRGNLGTVNLIVGAKGAEASHLARGIMGELIDRGVRCVVFDTTGGYAERSFGSEHASLGRMERSAIAHLVVGESFKVSIADFGLTILSEMLQRFGLPKTVVRYFESHVARRLTPVSADNDAAMPRPFLGMDALLRLAQDLEAEGQAVVGGALLSCLDAIKKTQVFASQPGESTAFWDAYAQIRDGGALVIDLSRLPRRAQTGIVASLINVLRDIAHHDVETPSNLAPAIFFDESQALLPPDFVADVIIPLRPLGLMSFFVTTMVTCLEDSLLYETDNLFLRQMTSDAEVSHLAKRGLVDVDSLRGIVPRLQSHHSLVIGKATGGYPIIFAPHLPNRGTSTGKKTVFSRTATAVRRDPTAGVTSRFSGRADKPGAAKPSLPLFPEDTPTHVVAPEPHDDERIPAPSPPPLPSVAQVTAMWDHLVKRVSRRRRILETVLSAARPLRVIDRKLVLSFPPQQRFQQELIESEEYRSLLEEELRKAFGVSLEVTTEVYPA